MARTFAYCRVSTVEQTTDNQVREIKGAGFKVDPKRVIVETVSGSTAAMQRKQFARLVDRLEAGDVLLVTKLDRLGRNAMDVRATVDALATLGVRVHCLALGGTDLTSPAGKMTMGVIAAVAEFERDLLVERTQAGLSRAKAEGRVLGRPAALTAEQRAAILSARYAGQSLGVLAKQYGVSRSAIQRVEKSGGVRTRNMPSFLSKEAHGGGWSLAASHTRRRSAPARTGAPDAGSEGRQSGLACRQSASVAARHYS